MIGSVHNNHLLHAIRMQQVTSVHTMRLSAKQIHAGAHASAQIGGVIKVDVDRIRAHIAYNVGDW